jgi:O-antigen chain-terminating methyltransferase
VSETPLENARRHADLGIPPDPASLGVAKRVVERATRWFVHRQAGFNRAVVATLAGQQGQIDALAAEVADLTTGFADLAARIEAVLADQRQERARFRGDHSALQSVLAQVRAGREPDEVVAELAELAEQPDGHDEFYADFENLHRGSAELIVGRLRAYLPDVEVAPALGPVVDIGTGRGEFLDLLAEAGIAGYGVDTNAVTVAQCRERGLEVVHADALHHLRSCADASLGAVTGFHLVEHLPFGLLLDLVAEARRVVAPGGVVVFETPNPGNLVVGASNFYIDPTHLRPVPPGLLSAVVWSRGFDPVEVRYLNASPPGFTLPDDLGDADPLRPAIDRLEELLTGPADYAVLGRVPTP